MDPFGPQTAHSFRADSHAVAAARGAALAFAREHAVPAERHDAIALAVSEAATNVVMHAYRKHEGTGTFSVALDIDDESLVVDVRDDGLGMRPRIDSPGLGLGLPIIGTVADAFAVARSEGGGTLVSMRFDLTG